MRLRECMPSLIPVLVIALNGPLWAQDKPSAPQGPGPRPGAVVQLKVRVAISRYQGDKRVSSVPYTLSVNSTDPGRGLPFETERSAIRMGAEVPVPATVPSNSDGKAGPVVQAGPPQYRAFGTNIDCVANTLEGGRFRLQVTVEESSPYVSDNKSAGTQGGAPVMRSFRVSNFVVLRDGQSEEISEATDKVSGEVVRVQVTLSVAK